MQCCATGPRCFRAQKVRHTLRKARWALFLCSEVQECGQLSAPHGAKTCAKVARFDAAEFPCRGGSGDRAFGGAFSAGRLWYDNAAEKQVTSQTATWCNHRLPKAVRRVHQKPSSFDFLFCRNAALKKTVAFAEIVLDGFCGQDWFVHAHQRASDSTPAMSRCVSRWSASASSVFSTRSACCNPEGVPPKWARNADRNGSDAKSPCRYVPIIRPVLSTAPSLPFGVRAYGRAQSAPVVRPICIS